MTFNKEELEIEIKVLKELLDKCDVYQRITLTRLIDKFKGMLKTIETGGMGE